MRNTSGKGDKAARENKKKPKMTLKEKRKLKRESKETEKWTIGR